MKKKSIPIAQMGKSYIQRRAFKSAGVTPKSNESSPKVPEKVIKAPKSKATSDYRLYSESEIDNYTPTSREPAPRTPTKATTVEKPKGSGSTGGSKGGGSSNAPKSGSTPSAKTETKSAPKPGIRMSASKLPVSVKQLEKSKPVDVSYKRTYSDTEKKMQEIMAKGKKADGSMSDSSQVKLRALQAKRRMAAQKSEKDKSKEAKKATGRSEDYVKDTMKGIRKEARSEERSERQLGRSNRRAIAKSVRAGKFNKRVISKSAK